MGKRAALISGLVVVAVITPGVLWWREFAVRVQVYRMRRSPDYLIRVIDSPEHSIAGQAVRRIFSSKDFPGTRVLQAYFADVARVYEDFKKLLDSHYDEVRLFIDSEGEFDFLGLCDMPEMKIEKQGMVVPWERITTDSGDTVVDVSPSVVIQAFLAEVHYRSSDFPDYPGAVFSFHGAGEAFPPGSLLSAEKPPDRPYCFVQWPEKLRKKLEDYKRRTQMIKGQ
jgi:hypothetical protein